MIARLIRCGLAYLALLTFCAPLRAESSAEPGTAPERAEAHGPHIGEGNPTAKLADPTEVRSDLALFTFVVFLLLLAILWKFAWGPISTALEKREASIANHIAEAKRSHEEAKQLLADYEFKLANAASEARDILDQGRRDTERVKQEILAEAKAGADTERQRALRDIEAATDQALQALAQRSADLAIELAGKFVRTKLTADDHARLVQEAVTRLPTTASSN